MSDIELKPCPFCGGEAERIECLSGVFVQCHKCWVGTSVSSSRGVATRAWNRRVGNAQTPSEG